MSYNISILIFAKLDWLTSSKRNHLISKKKEVIDFKRAFIYVHWSPELRPTKGEIHLLKLTKQLGLENIIILNLDSKHKLEDAFAHWDGLYTELIARKNIGRDLAGYRTALEFINVKRIEQIFFFNNSIYWLPSQLNSFMKSFISNDLDIISATVSHQPIRHMQSFALAARGKGVLDLAQAISKVRNTKSKRGTISFGEIKISKDLCKLGCFRWEGLIKYGDLIEEALTNTNLISQPRSNVILDIEARLNSIRYAVTNGLPLNPTHHLWFELYKLGFPGIKKDLIAKNPSRIPDLVMIKQLINPTDSSDLEYEKMGFLTNPKSIMDKVRRYFGF